MFLGDKNRFLVLIFSLVFIQVSSAFSDDSTILSTGFSVSRIAQPDSYSVTVSDEWAILYSAITPDLAVYTKAYAGDEFFVVESFDDTDFVKVNNGNRSLFLLKSSVTKLEELNGTLLSDLNLETSRPKRINPKLYVLTGIIVLLVLFLAVLLLVRSKMASHLRKRTALHITKAPANFTIESGNDPISLRQFLASIGIKVTNISSLKKLVKVMNLYKPDVIIVDGTIEYKVVDAIRDDLQAYRLSSATTLIIYNSDDTIDRVDPHSFGDAAVHLFPVGLTESTLNQILNSNGSIMEAAFKPVETSSYLAGAIEGSKLQDVLQMIETGCKEGCLFVDDEEPFGVIYFENGGIVNASTRSGSIGMDAMFEIFKCSNGSFYFKLNEKPAQKNCSISVIAALIEWGSCPEESNEPQHFKFNRDKGRSTHQ